MTTGGLPIRLFPEGWGREGLHHPALFVGDIRAEMARYAAEGLPTALSAEMAGFRPR